MTMLQSTDAALQIVKMPLRALVGHAYNACVRKRPHISTSESHGTDAADADGDDDDAADGGVDEAQEEGFESPERVLKRTRALPLAEIVRRSGYELSAADVSVHDCVSTGATSAVFRATWHGVDAVAKRFAEGTDDSFRAELRALAELSRHPNIVTLLGACAQPAALLVLERAHGGSLHDKLHGGVAMVDDDGACLGGPLAAPEPLSWLERAQWARDVALALAFMHAQRPTPLLHGDVKARNVLLDHGGRALLCDLGCVTPAPTGDDAMCLLGVGTPGWMAPELLGADGIAPSRCSSDVFSFGALLHELLAREVPYAGHSALEVMRATRKAKLPCDVRQLPNDAPSAIVELMRACMAFNPVERPDMGEIVRTLATATARLSEEPDH